MKVQAFFKLDQLETDLPQPSDHLSSQSDSPLARARVLEEGEPLTYTECVDLARAVRYCSDTLIEGDWSEENTIRGKRSIFTPSNFQSAKAFLRASVESIHSKRLYKSLTDTPLTYRSKYQSRMPTCHGCHGLMGDGQHQGSAPGKDVCTTST